MIALYIIGTVVTASAVVTRFNGGTDKEVMGDFFGGIVLLIIAEVARHYGW
jgi:hypothetical protein